MVGLFTLVLFVLLLPLFCLVTNLFCLLGLSITSQTGTNRSLLHVSPEKNLTASAKAILGRNWGFLVFEQRYSKALAINSIVCEFGAAEFVLGIGQAIKVRLF